MNGGGLRIVLGAPAAPPLGHGGAVWAIRQYELGLAGLGHEVLRIDGGGPVEDDALRFAAAADVLLNISGAVSEGALLDRVDRRVFVDLDPAFTQLWHTQGIDMGFEEHTHFATVGVRVGRGSDVPTCGRDWITTLPPVVLDEWPVARDVERDAFTTVGNWRSYGSIHHEGTFLGQKAHTLRTLLGLPARTGERFLLAFGIHADERADLDALARHGWELADPHDVVATPGAYAGFVRGSLAEIGIVKHGYVASGSGWFSDRSACYLASGRPVVTHDTGFGEVVPTGEGLLAFTDEDGAVEAVTEVRENYERHAKAARALAESHFDSDAVLSHLLEAVMSC